MVDGSEFADGFEPHFTDRADTEAGILRWADEEKPAAFMEPQQCGERCWTLNLLCGTEWVHNGDIDSVHFDSKADLIESATYQGVRQLTGDNRWAEPGCCDECDAAINNLPAPPRPVEVHPDQVPLIPGPGDTIPEGWTL
jgi:hypothetical protein